MTLPELIGIRREPGVEGEQARRVVGVHEYIVPAYTLGMGRDDGGCGNIGGISHAQRGGVRPRSEALMALQTSLNGSQQRGKKPVRRHKEEAEVQQDNSDIRPQWVEHAPLYLDDVLAFQAALAALMWVISWTVEQPPSSVPLSHCRR